MTYGYFKITAFAGTTAYMAKQGLPLPPLAAAISVVVELGGGLLDSCLAIRPASWRSICAVYVVIAALIAHRHFADGNQMSHFFKNMAITGGFLALMVSGAGRYSLDARKS